MRNSRLCVGWLLVYANVRHLQELLAEYFLFCVSPIRRLFGKLTIEPVGDEVISSKRNFGAEAPFL